MTPEKIKRVVKTYRIKFHQCNIEGEEYPHNRILNTEQQGLAHCQQMLDKIDKIVDEGDLEKAQRWLGFIQGVLFMGGMYTLDELKEHNRPLDLKDFLFV